MTSKLKEALVRLFNAGFWVLESGPDVDVQDKRWRDVEIAAGLKRDTNGRWYAK